MPCPFSGIDAALVPKLVTNAEVIVFCVVVLNLGETDEPPASASHGRTPSSSRLQPRPR